MLSPRYRFYNMWCDPAAIDEYPAINMLSICLCAIKMISICSRWTIDMLWRFFRCVMRTIKIWHPRPTAIGYWCAIKSLCYPLAIKPPMCALSINCDPHTHIMLSTRDWKSCWPSTNCRLRVCQQCAMRPPLYAINAQSNILSLSRCQLCCHNPDHATLCYRYTIHTLSTRYQLATTALSICYQWATTLALSHVIAVCAYKQWISCQSAVNSPLECDQQATKRSPRCEPTTYAIPPHPNAINPLLRILMIAIPSNAIAKLRLLMHATNVVRPPRNVLLKCCVCSPCPTTMSSTMLWPPLQIPSTNYADPNHLLSVCDP